MIDYDKIIPDRIANIQPSGIRKFFDIAQSVEGVISLSVGEPDFKTPWEVRKEAIRVLERAVQPTPQTADLSSFAAR